MNDDEWGTVLTIITIRLDSNRFLMTHFEQSIDSLLQAANLVLTMVNGQLNFDILKKGIWNHVNRKGNNLEKYLNSSLVSLRVYKEI